MASAARAPKGTTTNISAILAKRRFIGTYDAIEGMRVFYPSCSHLFHKRPQGIRRGHPGPNADEPADCGCSGKLSGSEMGLR